MGDCMNETTRDDELPAAMSNEMLRRQAEVELRLKEREADSKGKGIAVLQLGLWGALITALSGVIGNCVQNLNARWSDERQHLAQIAQEREKLKSTIAQEREKLKSTLIEKAVAIEDDEAKRRNLTFLPSSGPEGRFPPMHRLRPTAQHSLLAGLAREERT